MDMSRFKVHVKSEDIYADLTELLRKDLIHRTKIHQSQKTTNNTKKRRTLG